jgi:hypothetical protein
MTLAILSSLIAYAVTTLCAVVLLRRRGPNWRLRWLGVVMGVLPLLEAYMLLWDRGIVLAPNRMIADLLNLAISALCLIAIRLLDVENRDRQRTDIQLRLIESETAAVETASKRPEWLASTPEV